MAIKFRTKRIKRISVPGWKENFPIGGDIERRYTKTVKKDDISHITISPSAVGRRVTVMLTGRIFSIPTKKFSLDAKANAYAKKVMRHINNQIKEFGI